MKNPARLFSLLMLSFSAIAVAEPTGVYRVYNPLAGYHVYTTAPGEFLALTRDIGLRDEGVGFLVYKTRGQGMEPLHRLYNPNNGQHYYTLSTGERDILVRLGWHYEKDEGYLYPSARSGTREVFNLYNTRNGDHVYPAHRAEADAIVSRFAGIWQMHRSLGYGPDTAIPRRSPNFGNPTGTSDSSRPVPYTSSACTPNFPYKQGWFGADSTFSYPTSSTRAIWTFHDTFMGGTSRQDAPMVGNSVAVSECVNGRWSINYATRNGAFFDSGDGANHRLWPFHPFMSEGKLYYPAARIVKVGDDVFGAGTKLIRIDNPKSPPDQWNIHYLPLTFDREVNVGCGSAIHGGHVYLFGCFGDQMSISRLGLAGLGSRSDASSVLETLHSDNVWRRGFDWSRAKKIPVAANGGLSPRYNEELRVWQMLYFDSLTLHFAVRSAPGLTGPWSAPINVYYPRENFRPGVICYAAYEQIAFERDLKNEIAFTYTCNNLSGFQALKDDTSIYVPRMVRVPNPLRSPDGH
jgi:hypothetical protein